ncbi:MAG: PIN domain-containing protein [Deltaproteobacteria bacterium]|nr:PIN domain-containing protein [Deltaproteobacteria bacterium]
MTKRTYLDANVLIAAFRGESDIVFHSLEALDDPERQFVVSDYLRLEVLPKPTFLGRHEEVQFMQTFLEEAAEDVPSSQELTRRAVSLASQYDMTPIDALHVGAAVTAAMNELVTIEKATKPMCRVMEIKVISLHSENSQLS